jgi:hypothetical protein
VSYEEDTSTTEASVRCSPCAPPPHMTRKSAPSNKGISVPLLGQVLVDDGADFLCGVGGVQVSCQRERERERERERGY